MCEWGQVGEFGETSVEGGNMRAIYLADAAKYRKTYAEEVSSYLIEAKHGVVDIPVLDIDLAMRGVRHAINRDLKLLCAFLRSFRANLFVVAGQFRRKWLTCTTNKPA